jgi:DNA-binding XRE family transcriptional regulator
MLLKTVQIESNNKCLILSTYYLYLFEISDKNMSVSKKRIVLPMYQTILEQMGESIKLARKRRKLTAIQVAERADVSRSTLHLIEKGNPGVAIGAYFNVLKVLGLHEDFLKLAADDVLGRKLQDLNLLK